MSSITRLLFGPEGDRVLDQIARPGEGGLAARAREAREWCQTTPGTGSLTRQARWLRAQSRVRGRS